MRVLELVSSLGSAEATLLITTDKVYDPAQTPPHDEGHAFGGREPYSASKAAPRSWRWAGRNSARRARPRAPAT